MDYADAIVEFFLERRAKGTAISSADEQLVLRWEREGIPVSVVFAGVDQAFERKSEPPKSLSACGRWIRAAFKKWSGGDHLNTVERRAGARPEGEAPTAKDVESQYDRELKRLAALRESSEPALAAAAAELHDDLAALGESAATNVLSVVDEALAEAALERLPTARRLELIEAAEQPWRAERMSGEAWARARAAEVLRLLGA